MKYHPADDPMFMKPYIDQEGWETAETRFYYVHGGFEGTEVRFAFYFPERERYEGRFYQYIAPAPGGENASYSMTGQDNKVRFAHEHGAYFVESNMGGSMSNPPLMLHASAATAAYSRQVAVRLYGPHRPYGYVYGGSGGAYKTIGCIETTRGVWDGAVPYVVGTPMSIPYNMTIRAHALRVLGEKTRLIADAVDAGGSGDIYAGLNDEEKQALDEATSLGFPLQAWFAKEYTKLGSLPVLAISTQRADPGYDEDFWKSPGYLGADPKGSAVRDRIQLRAKLTHVEVPPRRKHNADMDAMTGVDTNWLRMMMMDEVAYDPWVCLDVALPEDAFADWLYVMVASGEKAGSRILVKQVEGAKITLSQESGGEPILQILEKLHVGDEVVLDNSAYIAMQTYHRHQLPEAGRYPYWDSLRDKDGAPKYPQRPFLFGPLLASGGGGGHLQDGSFDGKMISVCAMWDESAFPVNGDWYRQTVRNAHGGDESGCYRIYWADHALHDDQSFTPLPLQLCGYQGLLHQALIDVAAWVEQGKEPLPSTEYWFENSQIQAPDTARERKGLQPIARLTANGQSHAHAKVGEAVQFTLDVDVPEGAGFITSIRWSFDGDETYPVQETIQPGLTERSVSRMYAFSAPGVHFVSVLVAAQREGNADDLFTQIKNIGRVRVTVELEHHV